MNNLKQRLAGIFLLGVGVIGTAIETRLAYNQYQKSTNYANIGNHEEYRRMAKEDLSIAGISLLIAGSGLNLTLSKRQSQ